MKSKLYINSVLLTKSMPFDLILATINCPRIYNLVFLTRSNQSCQFTIGHVDLNLNWPYFCRGDILYTSADCCMFRSCEKIGCRLGIDKMRARTGGRGLALKKLE